MTAMFAMVAANHHALNELFNQASQFATVRLLWQNPNCLVASYNQHGPVHNARLHQFSWQQSGNKAGFRANNRYLTHSGIVQAVLIKRIAAGY